MDIQDHFLAKLSPQRAERLVNRTAWLIEIAKILNVPIIATAEEKSRIGGLATDITEKLPPDTKVLDKIIYDLAHQEDILNEVLRTGRKTAVLVGVETDVCIAHSAIGLIQNDFSVVVLADVTDSPGNGHGFGLNRVREAGALVISLKELHYEWIRAVSACNIMENEHLKSIGYPKDIVL